MSDSLRVLIAASLWCLAGIARSWSVTPSIATTTGSCRSGAGVAQTGGSSRRWPTRSARKALLRTRPRTRWARRSPSSWTTGPPSRTPSARSEPIEGSRRGPPAPPRPFGARATRETQKDRKAGRQHAPCRHRHRSLHQPAREPVAENPAGRWFLSGSVRLHIIACSGWLGIRRVIREEDLGRFSSVVRAMDVWFGFQWAAGSGGKVDAVLERVSLFLDDPSARDQRDAGVGRHGRDELRFE